MDNNEIIEKLNGRIDEKVEAGVSAKAAEVLAGLEGKASVEDVTAIKNQFAEMQATIKGLKEDRKKPSVKTNKLEDFLTENKETLKSFAEGNSRGLSIKAADATAVMDTAYSVTEGERVQASYLPGVVDAKRVRTNILPYLTVGRAASPLIKWFEYECDAGEFDCIDECQLKPSLNWQYKQKESSAKKLAAHTRICDEMWEDVPFVSSITQDVHRRLHDEKLNEYITTEIKAAAGAYANPAYSGTITLPNYWDAMEALIAAGACIGCDYDVIMVSCERYFQLFAEKDADGAYTVHPALTVTNGRIFFMGVEIVINHYLAADEYIAGSFRDARLLTWRDFEIKRGHINDDFIHNISTFVGESRFLFFIPDNCKLCFTTGLFAGILTDIAK